MKTIILLCVMSLSLFSSNEVILYHLEWQDNVETKTKKMNWYEAVYYCKELSLHKRTNWRLPKLRELQSLVDIYRYSPSIKKAFKFTTSKSYYWSSTVLASNKDKAWHVFYKYGDSYYSAKTTKQSVRCVRNR